MSLLRYALVGGAATCVHYAVLVALVETGALAAGPAAGVGALHGAAFSYFLNRKVTFRATAMPHRHGMPRFLLVASLGAALSSGIVAAGLALTSWHYLTWQIAATATAWLFSYGLNLHWTFREN